MQDSLNEKFHFKIDKNELQEILNFFRTSKYLENLTLEQQYFIDQFNHPKISKQLFESIMNNFQISNELNRILSPISNLFLFDDQLLQNYCQSRLISTSATLCFVLSWLCLEDLKTHKSQLNEMFQIISQIPKTFMFNIQRFCMKETFLHYLRMTNDEIDLDIFKKIVVLCDSYFFDLTVAELYTASTWPTRLYLIEMISLSIENNPDEFLENDFMPLIDFLSPYFQQLNENSLKLLSTIALARSNDDSIASVISILPKIIHQHISSETKLPEVSSNELYSYGDIQKLLLSFDYTDTFPMGLKPFSMSLFEKIPGIDSILPQRSFNISSIFFYVLQNFPLAYLKLFFESFAQEIIETRNNDLYVLFVKLMDSSPKFEINDLIINALIHPSIFFTKIVPLDHNNEIESIVIVIRKTIIDLFLTKYQEFMPNILQMIDNSPIIFSETIGRINIQLSNFNLAYITDEKTLFSIVCVLSQLWNLTRDINNNSEFQLITSCCATIFLFLFSILEQKESSLKCFSSDIFVNCFLSRIFEPSLQASILSSLFKFFIFYDKSIDITPTIQMIKNIFEVCKDKNSKLPEDIILILNEAIAINYTVEIYEPLITPITSFLNKFPSISFLKHAFQLFSQLSLLSSTFKMNYEQVKQLSSALRVVEGNQDPSDEILSSLLGLISQSRNVNTSSMFLIKRPSIITLIFSTLRTKTKLEELLNHFSMLCKHSVFNAMQCHKGELDFLLIKMMNNISKPFSFRGCEFDSITDIDLLKKYGIPLLVNILSIISSKAVVTQLIKYLSLGQELAIDILYNLNIQLSSSYKVSQSIFPITYSNDPVLILNDVSSDIINLHFTMQMLILIDRPLAASKNQKHVLFEFDSNNGNFSICYLISGNSIISQIEANGATASCIICHSLPSCQWIRVIFSLDRIDQNNIKLIFISNDSPASYLRVFCPLINCDSLICKIGYTIFSVRSDSFNSLNLKNDSIQSLNALENEQFEGFPCYIGKFSLYNDSLENPEFLNKIMILHSTGSNKLSDVNDFRPLFSYPSSFSLNSNNANRFSSCEIYSNSQTQIIPLSFDPSLHVKNILEIIADSQILEFLPLFRRFDVMPDIFLRLLLSFISAVFSYSKCLKQSFPFFNIIAQILMESKTEKLTYSLYTRFFSFISECTEPFIIKELITHILLNFELWIRAEPSQLHRISAHWGSSLFNTCGLFLQEAVSISSLLASFRIYFWYEPIECDIIRGKEFRKADLDICLIIQNLDRLLLSIIKDNNGFTIENVSLILSHCASCKDKRQIIHFLTLFQQNYDEFNVSKSLVIKKLFYNFNPNNEEIFIENLKTIYILAQSYGVNRNNKKLEKNQECQNNYNFKFVWHQIYSIMSTLNKLYCTPLLFFKLLEILQEYPLVYPIAIIVSFYLDESAMISVAKQIKLIKQKHYESILTNEYWMIFPILLAVYLPDTCNEKFIMVYFICSIINENTTGIININILTNVITAIDFLSSAMIEQTTEFERFESNIIKTLIDLNITANNSYKKALFSIGSKTLLLHFNFHSPALISLYQSSPFIDPSPNKNKVKSMSSPHFFESNLSSDIPKSSILYPLEENKHDFKTQNQIEKNINNSEVFPTLMRNDQNYSPLNPKSENIYSKSKNNSISLNSVSFQSYTSSSKQVHIDSNYTQIKRAKPNIIRRASYSLLRTLSFNQKNFKNMNYREEINASLFSFEKLLKLLSSKSANLNRYVFGLYVNEHEICLKQLFESLCQFYSAIDFNGLTMKISVEKYSSLDESILNNIGCYFNSILASKTIDVSLYESLNKFYNEISLIWNSYLKEFNVNCKKYFLDCKANALANSEFNKEAIVGNAFNDISDVKATLNNNFNSSTKIRSNFETMFRDLMFDNNVKSQSKKVKSFKSCSNFSQVKLNYFSKASSNPKTLKCFSNSFTNNDVLLCCQCEIINIINNTSTTFILTKEKIVLVDFKIILLSSLSQILRKKIMQMDTALEFHLKTREDILINFSPLSSKDVIKKILKCSKELDSCYIQRVSSYKMFNKDFNFTEQWRKRKITNFDYLMYINIYGGRTYRDPSNYPIFPWILIDFNNSIICSQNNANDNNSLNFSCINSHNECSININVLRDMSYPIGAQNESIRNILDEKFNPEEPISETNAMFFNAPSNPTIIAHWLIRCEPFTSLHIDSENGNFGYFNRLFFSLEMVIEQMKSNTSCWEATPEFFSMPEVFMNLNNIKIPPNETILETIKLPPWCSNAFEFVYTQRKILECEAVSSTLHLWIDLLFGYLLQNDADAISKYNVFSPLLQSSVWKNFKKSEEFNDEVKKLMIETTLMKSGQMPSPLFKNPHPSRSPTISYESLFSKVVIIPLDFKGCSIELAKSYLVNTNSKNVLMLIIIYEDGSIESYNIQLNELIISQETDKDSTADINLNGIYTTSLQKGILISYENNESIIISYKGFVTSIVLNNIINDFSSTNDELQKNLYPSNIYCFSYEPESHLIATYDNDIIVLIQGDGVVYSGANENSKTSKKNKNQLNLYEIGRIHCERPVGLALSNHFDSLAIALIEGGFYLYHFQKFKFHCKCDTDDTIQNIFITNGWGFIVAQTLNNIYLFNINGFQIKSIPNPNPNIIKWCHWKSEKGFDYIGVIRRDGSIVACEAFYLNFSDPISYITGTPVSMEYCNEIRSFIVITSNRNISIIPYLYTEL